MTDEHVYDDNKRLMAELQAADLAAAQTTIARLTAERDQLKETLELVNRVASPDAFRNLDQAINDLAHIADEVRFALSRLDSPGSGGDRGRP